MIRSAVYFLKANGNLMHSNVFRSPKQSIYTFESAWYNVKLSVYDLKLFLFVFENVLLVSWYCCYLKTVTGRGRNGILKI